jgi:hypothetical protein
MTMEREAIELVTAERARQREKWGEEQPHPVVTRLGGITWNARAGDLYSITSARAARETLHLRELSGIVSFGDILVEELAEAVEASAAAGETSDDSLGEWVQVAAVSLQIVETILRRRARSGVPAVGWDGDGREATDAPR